MSDILDYAASVIFGGTLFLSMLNFYVSVGETQSSESFSLSNQQDTYNVSAILESDFQKIGYGVTDSARIILADSAHLTFRADIRARGVIDTVKYSLDGYTPGSSNPLSRVLSRRVNSTPSAAVAEGVSGFKLYYFDASGNPTTVPGLIHSIRVSVTVQGSYGIDSTYPAVCWDRLFQPRNLR